MNAFLSACQALNLAGVRYVVIDVWGVNYKDRLFLTNHRELLDMLLRRHGSP